MPGSIPGKFYTFNTYGFYAQDDIRATSRVTLNLGMRYEVMTTPNEENNRGAALRNLLTDANTTIGPPVQNPWLGNISPRAGFAWDIRGNGKTSVRAGVGLLYDVANMGSTWARASTGTPPFTSRFTLQNPANFTLPFNIPANAIGKFLRSAQYDINQPQLLQGNLTFEQQLPLDSVLSVAYAGSRGYYLLQNFEANPVTTATLANGVKAWPSTTAACANTVPSCRVNPNWGSLDVVGTRGDSWYNSLQLQLTKRATHGVQFQSSYTFSKALDTSQSAGVVDGDGTGVDPQQRNLEKSYSLFDVTHNWRFNVLYRVPDIQSQHFAAKLAKGWWVGTIVALQTGYPFTPRVGGNRANNTYGNDRPITQHHIRWSELHPL